MYGKLFKTTFTGSLYGAGSKVLIVWCWIIANKDKTGRIEINPEELASRIGDMTPDEVSEAVNFLCTPDTKSRSKAYDGRRLIKEGQYLYWAVNSAQYNAIRNEDDRKAYERERKAKQRASKPLEDKDSCPDVCPGHTGTVRDSPGVSAHIDVDVDLDVDKTTLPSSAEDDATRPPSCPYESIKDSFNQRVKQSPKVLKLNDRRKRLVRITWLEGPERQNVEWWDAYWDRVNRSDFLQGRTPSKNGGTSFVATFDWLINQTNMLKVLEGNYDKREKEGGIGAWV